MSFSAFLRCAFAAPVLTLAACNVSIGTPEVKTIVSQDFVSDPALDGYVYSNNNIAGTGVVQNTEIRVGDHAGDGSRRGILSFPIDQIPAGAKILEATLEVHQGPATNDPYALGPNLLVDHVDLQGALDKTDYESLALHPVIGVLSTDATPGIRTLSVVAAVQSDVDAGRTSSEYRLKFQFPTNSDGMADTAEFNDSEDHLASGILPRLIVKWEE